MGGKTKSTRGKDKSGNCTRASRKCVVTKGLGSPFEGTTSLGSEDEGSNEKERKATGNMMTLRKRKVDKGPISDEIIYEKKAKLDTNRSIPTLHFAFLTADKSLGAIPARNSACNTFKKFFDQSWMAAALLQTRLKERDMVGVSVETDAFKEPFLVPWRDQASYHGMLEQLHSVASAKSDHIFVKVRGVVKEKTRSGREREDVML